VESKPSKGGKGKSYALAAVAIAALLITSLLLYQAYSNSGSTKSNSSSSSTSPQALLSEQQVGSRIGVFDADLSGLDAQNMSALYTSTAVLSWSGKGINSTQSPPLNWAGTYRGENISALYTMTMAYWQPTRPIAFAYDSTTAVITNLATRYISPNSVSATFTLSLSDQTSGYGTITATIDVQQHWINQTGGSGGSAWYMDQDSWNFTATSVQYPVG
jgi:hypothetical protein